MYSGSSDANALENEDQPGLMRLQSVEMHLTAMLLDDYSLTMVSTSREVCRCSVCMA